MHREDLSSFLEKIDNSFLLSRIVCLSYKDYPHFFLETIKDYFISKYDIKEYSKNTDMIFSEFYENKKQNNQSYKKIIFINAEFEIDSSFFSHIKNKNDNTYMLLVISENIVKRYKKKFFQYEIHKINQLISSKDIFGLHKIYEKKIHKYIDAIFSKYEKIDTNFMCSLLYKAKFVKLDQFNNSIKEFEKINISGDYNHLFELSNLLFNKNKNEFYKIWHCAKKNISIDLLNSYLRKQLWKSFLYIKSKNKNVHSELFKGIPYHFKKHEYKKHSLDKISAAIESIHKKDILLKKHGIKHISNCDKAVFGWFNFN
jgi:hypothetical protein